MPRRDDLTFVEENAIRAEPYATWYTKPRKRRTDHWCKRAAANTAFPTPDPFREEAHSMT